MKLLWTIDLGYMPFALCKSGYYEFGKFVDNGNTVLLPCSSHEKGNSIIIQYITVDKTTGQRVESIPIKTESAPVLKRNISNLEKWWDFGDKDVRCLTYGRFIEGWRNDKKLWKFTTWAWLSTEVIEKNSCIIFGTDGMGGRLYCLELETGKVISEIKTQHSAFYDFYGFNWHNGNLVVYAKDAVAVVNPFTGEIVDAHKIPSKKYPYRSFLKVVNGYAYCCVTTDRNEYSVMCFDLELR